MTCFCGHVEDEHNGRGECEVDDCPCFLFEGESGSGNARRSEWGNSVPATPLQAWVRTKNGRVWISKDGLSWIDLGPVELNVLVPVSTPPGEPQMFAEHGLDYYTQPGDK